MARPEFCVMNDFVERMARQKDDPQIARLYGRLLPLNKIVVENFFQSQAFAGLDRFRGKYG